jgi:hypothetical protein
MPRYLCQFSCGATSAVAVKLMLTERPGPILIVNAYIKEEPEDNRRFLADCEKWFGEAVTVLRDTKYGASAREVFRRERYLKGPEGAPCTRALKRKVLDAIALPGDVLVLGYDAAEEDRLDDFRDRYPERPVRAPLIERGLSKEDCQAMIERAGIMLPESYRKGGNNCIGCVKGGQGYWNWVRREYPADFEEMAQIEQDIGPSAFLFAHRTGPLEGQRFSLRELDPTAGRHNETVPACSFFCDIAEKEIAA